MKIEVNKPCCVCGASESQFIFEIDYSSLHYPGKFSIRKCNNCGLLFNSPRLNDNELFKLYDANYYFFQRRNSDEFRRIIDLYLRTVALISNGLTEKRAAEIGSAKGYLLALMKRLGWEVQGIEISKEAAQYAISKFGVPTFNGTIENYSNDIHKDVFPVVLAIDVIEHVPDPIYFLNSIDKILSPNGLLIIDTPNGNSQNIEYLGLKWQAFNPFHIYFFSISILELLLTNMGYSIEKSFSYNNRLEKISLKQDLRNLLFRLGILNQVENAYTKLKNLAKTQEKNIESLISDSIKIIERNTTYLDTDDSRDDLAIDNRGNNIVVIARKNPPDRKP